VRVVSLLPAATEIVCAIGARDHLVAVSHECDWPPEVAQLPRVTTTPIDVSQSGAAIDAEVRAARDAGHPVITVDAEAIRALRPDVLLTQGLCEVCAVADGEVRRVVELIHPEPRMVSLAGRDLAGIWRDVRAVGELLALDPAAQALVRRLRTRLVLLESATPPLAERRKVAVVEWLDPVFLGGHWVPELVRAAGGTYVGAAPGEHSRETTWAEVAALEPAIVVIALCGFGIDRAVRELEQVADPAALALLSRVPVWVLDGNAYTTRPGPRIVDGAERLRAMILDHPLPGMMRWTPAPSGAAPVA
jgi:iron complex transport system substrate-binding protein